MTQPMDSAILSPRILGEWFDPGYGRERAWVHSDIIAIHLLDAPRAEAHIAWHRRPQFDEWAAHAWSKISEGASRLSADEVMRCDAFGNWDGSELAAPTEVDLLLVDGRPLAGELMNAADAEQAYQRVAPHLR